MLEQMTSLPILFYLELYNLRYMYMIMHKSVIPPVQGRNLALMQHTVQSSTHGPWRANQAVDGKIDSPNSQTSQEDTCTHTAMYDGPGSWTLGFSVPVSVTRFLLYNRRYLGVPGTGKYFTNQDFYSKYNNTFLTCDTNLNTCILFHLAEWRQLHKNTANL